MSQLDTVRIPASRQATFSIPSILSIVCVVGAWFSGAGWALVLSVLGAAFGVIGCIVALLPGVRGGILSTFSILLGVLGVVIAIVRLIAD